MATEVQIVLPDNLRSTYLRGDFVERGSTYSTDRVHPDSDLYDADTRYNQHSIVIGFKLVDTETREEVGLARVVSLKLSNDPEFSPGSTVDIVDWPETPGSFDPTKNYRRKLNPLYFFGESGDQYRFGWDGDGEEPGEPGFTGFFIIEGWPLSANGGLTAAYLQATLLVEGTAAIVSYPNGYGLFDQIYWQSERPSTPGKPQILQAETGYTGRKSTWEFRASEEPSTSRWNTGVSRYLADIVELRPVVDGEEEAFHSTRAGASNPHVGRTMLPGYPAEHTYQWGYTFDGEQIVDWLGIQPAHNELPLTAGQPLAVYTVNEAALNVKRPDIAVQANIKLNIPNEPDVEPTYYIGIYNGLGSNPNAATQYICKVYVPYLGAPTAYFYRLVNGSKVPNNVVTTTLPEYAGQLLRTGCLLEMYMQERAGDGRAFVRAYIGAEGGDESFLVASVWTDSLGAYAALGGMSGASANKDGLVQFNELAIAAGRFILGGDAGDCSSNGVANIGFPHALAGTEDRPWDEQLDVGWMVFAESAGDVGDAAVPDGDILRLHAPSSETTPSYCEVQSVMPTFGSRAFVDFEVSHHSGEFYVALSQSPSGSRPMGARLESAGPEAMTSPAIAIVFSGHGGGISIKQRREDGSLASRRLRRYALGEPGEEPEESFTLWQIQISNISPSGRADGTWLVLRRDGEFWGSHRLDMPMPESIGGLGHYVAVGVRGGLRSEDGDWTETNDTVRGSASVRLTRVSAEPGVKPLDGNAAAHHRRFTKAKLGAQNAKPYLGQQMVCAQTDLGDYGFAVPPSPQDYDAVKLVARESVTPYSAPNTVDGVPLRAGDRILLPNQEDPATNGIYVVNIVGTGSDGSWTRASDLSSDSDVEVGRFVQVQDVFEVRVATITNIATSQAPSAGILDAGPSEVDGVPLRTGDRVLVHQQTDKRLNGIYVVQSVGSGSNGTWTRAADADSYEEFGDGSVCRVSKGGAGAELVFYATTTGAASMGVAEYTLEQLDSGAASSSGTTWWVDEWVNNFVLDTTPITFRSGEVVQRIGVVNSNALYQSVQPEMTMLEVMIRPSASGFIPAHGPRVRLYRYESDGSVGEPVSAWHGMTMDSFNSMVSMGAVISRNHLCQFDMTASEVPALEGASYWLAVSVPPGCEIGMANSKRYAESEIVGSGPLMGATKTFSVWHKTFLRRSERRNNALDGAYIHVRFVADSHAKLASNASPLSEEVRVDRSAPAFASTGRPRLTEFSEPTVRTATITIEAGDELSGVLAFRIISEGDDGVVRHGPWQAWKDFVAYQTLEPVRAVITSNSGLTGAPGVVDGISDLGDGDRILAAGQASPASNGIYVINESGAWARATDFDEDAEISNSVRVLVQEGSLYADTAWYLSPGDPNEAPPYYEMGVTGLSWLREQPGSKTVNYTVYFQGKWPLSASGERDDEMLAQNQSLDGSRRVWAQVMDRAGNIGESLPLTVTAQAVALVDTTAPEGSAILADEETGTAKVYLNDDVGAFKLHTTDRITGVKDYRLRLSQSGIGEPWSDWAAINEYVNFNVGRNVPADDETPDGYKRVEVQLRDYGNNANQSGPLWEVLTEAASSGLVFTCASRWTQPGETKEWLYLAGVEARDFNNYGLEVSGDSYYTDGTAYAVVSDSESSLGRTVAVRDSDDITLTVNGTEWTRFIPFAPGQAACYGAPGASYQVDGERGLIVFCATIPEGADLVVTVKRRSGVLYRWDGAKLERVYDLGYYDERAVLSILPLTGIICLGGHSGRIWAFDGDVVLPSLFTAEDDDGPLPVTVLVKHRFTHEDTAYVYAGTAKRPRLFRFSDGAELGVLEMLGNGFLTGKTGGITCGVSAYNRLFLGTDSNKILQYIRLRGGEDEGDSEGELVETELRSKYLGASEPYSMPVSSLSLAGGQVLAGIANKPEVWSYTQVKLDAPVPREAWSSTDFDRWFINNPTPWQFYASVENQLGGGDTMSSENHPLLTWAAITDPNNETGMRELITIDGQPARTVVYRAETGSDWEQASSGAETWTMEFDVIHIDGEPGGYQSIEVADGRYRVRLDLGRDSMTVHSGENSVVAAYEGWSDEVEARSLVGGPVYPERSNKKVWNFGEDEFGHDYGPYWPGDTQTDLSVMGWLAGHFVIGGDNGEAGTVMSEPESDTATFTRVTKYLRVKAIEGGDPVVYWADSSGVVVDNHVSFFVRLRLNLGVEFNADDAVLKMTWSQTDKISGQEFLFAEELPIQPGGGFVTYRFNPAWTGPMRSVALQLSGVQRVSEGVGGLADGDGDYTFDMDYVSVNTDAGNNNIRDNLTPIRIGVSGRDVKVWVGRLEEPLVDKRDFLQWPTEKSEIIFGKIDPSAPGTVTGWGGTRFYIGEMVAPVTYEERDFDIMWRFPSTGGVTHLVDHGGTVWALTQGVRENRKADNPNDRAAKAWSYSREMELWKPEGPAMPRQSGDYGFVRALCAAAYGNSLVACGQRARITYEE